MIKVYERKYSVYGGYLEEITLTGRWKIKVINNYPFLAVEVKGFFKNKWISDTDIEIQDEETYINECAK